MECYETPLGKGAGDVEIQHLAIQKPAVTEVGYTEFSDRYWRQSADLMRTKLASLDGQTITVRATLAQWGERGTRHGYQITAMLTDVETLTGDRLADHLWVTDSLALMVPGVREGRRLVLTAVVGSYDRDSDQTRDYTLGSIYEVACDE